MSDVASIETPYWRLSQSAQKRLGRIGVWRRLVMAGRTVGDLVRRSAPVSAITVTVAQLTGAAALAASILVSMRAIAILLDGEVGFERVQAALPTLLLLGALLILRIASDTATSLARARLIPRARRLAEERLFKATLEVGLSSYDEPVFYDQLQRARDRGLLNIEEAILSSIELAGALVGAVGATAALAVLNPVLPLLLALAVAPDAWAALSAARMQYRRMTETISLMRQAYMMGELASERRTASEIRSHQAENYVLSEYRRTAEALEKHQVAVGVDSARRIALGRLLSTVGLGLTFLALGLMIKAEWLDLAVAGAAVIAIRTAGGSFAQLALASHQLIEKALYISDYQEFLEEAQTRKPQTHGCAAPLRPGCIRLENVSFSYPGAAGPPAISDVSLSIEAGQTVALVGENGSGKTTLAKLIAGLYCPTSGRITWDGVDIQTMVPEERADRVTMVLQEPVRWPRSARDNVRIGRYAHLDPDGADLREAAQQSQAQEVVDGLPEHWETLLSREFKGGHDLSAGQWQRFAVARGLYRDAPIVIWDEPTAPLDAKAEHAVYETLRRLGRGRTVILITHRLGSVRHTDRIFYLDHGVLTEQGTHDELMRRSGAYAELYRLQLRLYADDIP